ncbi:MAG: membrane protein [Candidatus Binatia bacterium]|nr:MAG: membrane protein [Candidatus Binatia bacterium]
MPYCLLCLHVRSRRRSFRAWAPASVSLLAVAALSLPTASSPARAHPLEPAIVELRQLSTTQWQAVAWKPSGATAGPIQLVLPSGCMPQELDLKAPAAFACNSETMAGATVALRHHPQARNDVWLRARFLDGREIAGLVEPTTGHFRITRADLLPWSRLAATYFALGTAHVLEGVDHLLFLTGLVWLLRRTRAIVVAASMFTLGHTIALLLAGSGAVHLDPGVVEVFIGASIALVARELWFCGGTRREAQASYFGLPFGLLHGLGFASTLGDLGAVILPAVLFFNLGVEVGQLAWVCMAAVLLAQCRRAPRLYGAVTVAAAVALGIAGAWLTLGRIAALLQRLGL